MVLDLVEVNKGGSHIGSWIHPDLAIQLDKYREKANRDRFILPVDKDISYFIDIIDKCVNSVNEICNIEI